LLFISVWLLLSILRTPAATNGPVFLFMPDGQMRSSHLLRVYVSADIQPDDKPELTLLSEPFMNQRPPGWTHRSIPPSELARSQQWTEKRDGIGIGRTGTLLVFDLRQAGFTVVPWNGVTPVLKWGEPRLTAIGDRPVYLGNLLPACVWAFLFVGTIAVVIGLLASLIKDADGHTKPGWKRLLLNPQGRLSLSKTQAAFWTLCVTGMVVCFGLTRLEVPVIPESLVALMGLSLATRAVIFVTEQKDKSNLAKLSESKPSLSDLIHSGQVTHSTDNPVAITKAQMVVWTCVAGLLFLLKSLLSGELWEVPWQLVTLMGISQASYVIPPVHKTVTSP